ncbi:MAG: FixH family protein [Pseudomonadota bacterium]
MTIIRPSGVIIVLSLMFAVCAVADSRPVEWQATSQNGLFKLHVAPLEGDYSIGEYQQWLLRLTTPDGEPVSDAQIVLGGGMKGHGHGLPSQPRVIAQPEPGRYVIDGVLFNMAGDWTLMVLIQTDAHAERAQVELALSF